MIGGDGQGTRNLDLDLFDDRVASQLNYGLAERRGGRYRCWPGERDDVEEVKTDGLAANG